jgi:hypothetical protein
LGRSPFVESFVERIVWTMDTDEKLDKQQVYDQFIFSLMGQIVDICEKNGIAMLAHFCLPTLQEPTLACTTCLTDESGSYPRKLGVVVDYIFEGEVLDPEIVRVDSEDGEKVTLYNPRCRLN